MCDSYIKEGQESQHWSAWSDRDNSEGDSSSTYCMLNESLGSENHSLDHIQSTSGLSKTGDLETSHLTLPSGMRPTEGKKLVTSPTQGSNLVRGFFFMNGFCVLNNCAALSFKVLLRQGVSILVLCLFRNISLLLFSLLAALTLQKGCLREGGNSGRQLRPLIPLRLSDASFLQT